MKNIKMILKKRLRDEWLPDYVCISIKATVGRKGSDPSTVPAEQPRRGNFNRHGHCLLCPEDPKRGRVIRRTQYDIITKKVSIRYQVKLKEIVLAKLGLSKAPSVKWDCGINYLSPRLRYELRDRGISLKKLRRQILSLGDDQLERSLKDLQKDYANQFDVAIPEKNIKAYISKIEICHDEVGACNFEMAKDRVIISRFDEVIHNNELSYSIKNKKHVVSKIKAGADKSEGVKSVKVLRGYKEDGSIEKVYLKCIDKCGSLNRVETIFSKKSLDKHLQSRLIFSIEKIIIDLKLFGKYRKLSDEIRLLSKIRCDRHFRIVGIKPLSCKPKKRNLVRRAIKAHCHSFANEIFKYYYRWKVLNIGSRSTLSKGARRKIWLASKQIKLFKKSGRAEYILCNDALKKFETIFTQ